MDSINRDTGPEKGHTSRKFGRGPKGAAANARRRWKHRRATSLQRAMEMSVQYAKEVHNLSVIQISERMGMASHWRLYKWMAEGNMPIRYVQAFEHACGGCDFLTRYLASAGHKVVIDIPTGRTAEECELSELQALLSEAGGALVRFYRDEIPADQALESIEGAMRGLGYHRDQVMKHSQPELSLFDEEGDTDA